MKLYSLSHALRTPQYMLHLIAYDLAVIHIYPTKAMEQAVRRQGSALSVPRLHLRRFRSLGIHAHKSL